MIICASGLGIDWKESTIVVVRWTTLAVVTTIYKGAVVTANRALKVISTQKAVQSLDF